MSKKILKRSLALGALMAFVITGNVFAAGKIVLGTNGYEVDVNNTHTYTSDNNNYYGGYSNVDLNGHNLVLNNVYSGGSFNFEGTGDLEIHAIKIGLATSSSGQIDIKGDLLIDAADGNAINMEGVGTVVSIKANDITLKPSKNGITTGSNNQTLTISADSLSGSVNEDRNFIRSARNNTINIDVDYVNIDASKNLSNAIKMTGGTLNFSADSGQVLGNIVVDSNSDSTYGLQSGSVNLTLGKDVVLTGAIETSNTAGVTKENTSLSIPSSKLTLNGATWNMTGASSLTNATFNAGSELVIDGETFKYVKGGENVYALNGVGADATLNVTKGAKLTIDDITETTYNIATGFKNLADAKDKWELSDINTLMQGVAWTDTNGLQVEVFAKEAEQMATEMGVSNSTAQSVANVTAAAQAAIDGGAVAEPEGTGNDKAVALVQAMANANPQAAGQAFEAVSKMAEAGGNSGTAASIVKNVTGVTNDRLSFNCGHSAPHKGGHGVGLFEEGSGADVWVEYVHGKDKVEDMPSSAGATSYEGQYNGIVMGVDFKKVNKFQSGFAFNYGEGDTNSVGSAARTHSDYDFWGIGYYGSIHNDDSNVIFDIGYAKTDSDVETKALGMTYNASPETTTWTAGVKVEKLYQNENVQIVPYTGLRFMSIDPEDYSTECASSKYQMERQNVWLLPLGVSIKQEVTNDNGWTVSPRVDLSYIWAFGDTDSEMEFSTLGTKTNIGYEVMDDGSFLGLVGIEAHKGQWGFGVSYSYQKGDHSTSKKWFIDANYSF